MSTSTIARVGVLSPWTLVLVALAALLGAGVHIALAETQGAAITDPRIFALTVAAGGLLAAAFLRWALGVQVVVTRTPPLGFGICWAAVFFLIALLSPEGFRTMVDSVWSIVVHFSDLVLHRS